MKFIFEIFVFFVTLPATVWWFTVIILPLFYGIPKSLYLVLVKKEGTFKVPCMYFYGFLKWNIIYFLLFYVLISFFPDIFYYLKESFTFYMAQFIAVIYCVGSLFSKKQRDDMEIDFNIFVEKHSKL